MIRTREYEKVVADTGPTRVLGVPLGRRVSNAVSGVDHLIRLPTFKYTILADAGSHDSFLALVRRLFYGCRDRAVSFIRSDWRQLRMDAAAFFFYARDGSRRVWLPVFLHPNVSVHNPQAAAVLPLRTGDVGSMS